MEKTAELSAEVEKTLRAWAAITIIKLRKSMRDKGVATRHLYKSFSSNISYTDGFPSAVTISFMFHGKFVDMGVGNGVKISDVKGNAAKWKSLPRKERKGLRPRLAKRWYSPVIYGEMNILSVLLLRKYGIQTGRIMEGSDQLSEDLSIVTDIKMKF